MDVEFVLCTYMLCQAPSAMYDVCHPSYYEICQLGCKDDVKTTTAFHTYLELCEERKLWDISYKYNESLDLIYFEARKNKHAQLDIYVPWPVKYNIKLEDIESIQLKLNIERFILISKSNDGQSLFHVISSGLCKPQLPQQQQDLRLAEKKSLELHKELRKNSRNLYEMAKIGSKDIQNQTTNE